MKVEKVIIFTDESFPNGMAATNRIIGYCKGFLENNIGVEVVCLRRTETKDKMNNTEVSGSYQDINFKYLSSSTIKKSSFLQKRVDLILINIKLLLFGFGNINSKTISLYYSSHTIPALILWFVHKLKSGVILKEESEHPDVYLNGKNRLSKILFQKMHYKLFDVYLLMTKNLITYFKTFSKTPALHVPMTVDLKRFDPDLRNHDENIHKILYTGQLDDSKDGVDLLLKAFSEVYKSHNNYRLHLFGPTKSEESLQEYKNMVKDLGIDEVVFFEGLVTRNVITEKVLNANILVLPRPDSLQAQNGFPTKLGEYLASGNPTLVTSVGELPDYLTDGKSTFMAIPGDIVSLEKKLYEIIENYDFAKKVGLNGRKVAELNFNNINQAKSIINYFK